MITAAEDLITLLLPNTNAWMRRSYVKSLKHAPTLCSSDNKDIKIKKQTQQLIATGTSVDRGVSSTWVKFQWWSDYHFNLGNWFPWLKCLVFVLVFLMNRARRCDTFKGTEQLLTVLLPCN